MSTKKAEFVFLLRSAFSVSSKASTLILVYSVQVIAISCSICKEAYHNKVNCFHMDRLDEPCSLGVLAKSIVPPSWIVKVRSIENNVVWLFISRSEVSIFFIINL